MFQGRVSVFSCDFCDDVQQVQGYSLPDGWKWIAEKDVDHPEIRHICKKCREAGKHGTLTLVDSGRLSSFSDWLKHKKGDPAL